MQNQKPHIAGLQPIKQELEPGIYAICSCGLSSNQPFCDGSHEGTPFQPNMLHIEQRQRFSFCTCKHSSKMPFCDSSHKAIIRDLEENNSAMLP